MSRAPSPLIAAIASGLVPGAGQWYAGSQRRGLWLLGITLTGVVPVTALAVLVLFVTGPRLALDLSRPFFEHPGYLLILLALNGLVLAFRLVAAIDAFLLAGGRSGGSGLVVVAIVSALLTVAAALPHLWVAQRNLALYDLFTYDYSVDEGQATTTTLGTTTTIAVPTTPTTPTTDGVSTTTTSTTLAPTTTTTTLPPLAERRINVLLLGGDAGPDRRGIRTDTIIVASIDPITGETAMFSVPRNMRSLAIPPGHPAYDWFACHCWPDLINALYQSGLANPDLFPGGSNSGARAVMDVVGNLLGIEIDHYVLVDLLGFVDVIDALGGLTITVTEGVYDELYTRPGGEVVPVAFPPGTYEMDGEEALSYARVRRGTNDYYRMGRQRCVLEAVAAQTDAVTVMRRLPELVPAVQGSVLTDIPVPDWPDYIELSSLIQTDSIVSVRFIPNAPELTGTGTSYIAGYDSGGYPIPNIPLIRQTVITVMTTPATDAAARLGVDPLGEVCH